MGDQMKRTLFLLCALWALPAVTLAGCSSNSPLGGTTPAAASAASTTSVASSTSAAAVPFPNPVGQSPGVWTGVFRDEFMGSSVRVLDSDQTTGGTVRLSPGGPIWKAWYPNDAVGDGNQHSNNPGTELEYYDFSGLSLDGASTLTLTATHDNLHGSLSYTSGMIQSSPTFNPLYGYFEARMKLPAVSGSWPAFWMISSSFEWPPEFDIMENFGAPGSYECSNQARGRSVFADHISVDVTQWQVYGFKWSAGYATWYLNGTQVADETNSASVSSVSMYLVANLAVRNADTASFAAQVDYIRGWQ